MLEGLMAPGPGRWSSGDRGPVDVALADLPVGGPTILPETRGASRCK